MYPWFAWWAWAPRFQYPFSGPVVQKIAPETDWFLGNISSEVGDAVIEREVFQKVASYGKQIGIMAEILLPLAKQSDVETIKEMPALEQLKALSEKVTKIKAENKERLRENAQKTLDKLAETDREGLVELLKRYQD